MNLNDCMKGMGNFMKEEQEREKELFEEHVKKTLGLKQQFIFDELKSLGWIEPIRATELIYENQMNKQMIDLYKKTIDNLYETINLLIDALAGKKREQKKKDQCLYGTTGECKKCGCCGEVL